MFSDDLSRPSGWHRQAPAEMDLVFLQLSITLSWLWLPPPPTTEQGDPLLPQPLTSWTRVCVYSEAVTAAPAVLICLRLLGPDRNISLKPLSIDNTPPPPAPDR